MKGVIDMEKPYTKEQLIECIGILDNYLAKVESFLDEIRGEEIPEEYKEDYEAMLIEHRVLRNMRCLFQDDLLVNHRITI